MSVAVVLIGGDIPDRRLLDGVEDADVVIAADGGVRIARSHGLPVHVLIGDLDSASEGDQAWAKAEGAEIIEFPSDKDATDLELALEYANSVGVDRVIALGVDGGRLDHELGNWAVLSVACAAQVEIRADRGVATVLHGGQTFECSGEIGDVVSLLPTGGDATGVTTTGLKWPLADETLPSGSTRGVSNEIVDASASVTLRSGTLLVVRP